MECIRYASGYAYQLRETYSCVISIKPPEPIRTEYIDLLPGGTLTIRRGYAWDGPSGPTIDTDTFMRGSLVHDVLYQLLREKHLPQSCRPEADRILRDICREDGMMGLRAWWVHLAVTYGGGPSADPALIEPDKCAPEGCECTASSVKP